MLVLSCKQFPERRIDEKLSAVNQAFMILKNEGTLPGLRKDVTGGSISYFHIDKSLRKQLWFQEIEKTLPVCRELYVAQVEIGSLNYSYFFCSDTGQPQLVGSYQEHSGQLTPLPP